MRVSGRMRLIPPSGTLRVMEIVQRMIREGGEVLRLDVGDPGFDTPEHIQRAAYEALKEGFTHYTPSRGILELRKTVSSDLKEVDERLIRRGELLLDLNFLEKYGEELGEMNRGKVGSRPYILTRHHIQFLAVVRYLFGMPYRQLEGFARALNRLVSRLPSADDEKLLEKEGVSSIAGSVFGKAGEGHIRLS